MATILGANSDSGYEISNSLRFNDDDSANLSRTVGTPTNEKIYTISVWFKKGNVGVTNTMIGSPPEGDRVLLGDLFEFFTNGSASSYLRTNKTARDVAAFYHLMIAYDVTQGTAANRVKLYVNGTQETFDLSTTFPAQDDTNGKINKSGTTLEIGHGHSGYADGYMSDFNFIDGQALDPTYFGETNENGVWIPKKYVGTYGNNGFFLEFQQTGTSANSSGMGADTSGNDNHFAVNNLSAHDVTTDTPTNNFCTLNSLDTRDTLSEGNLKRVSPQGASTSTISVGSGKWYVEFLVVTQGAILSGFVEDGYATHGNAQPHDHGDNALFYTSTGQKIIDSSFSSYGGTASAGDIVGCAFDLDNNTAQFFINNSSQGTFSKTYTAGASYFFAASDVTSATNSTDFINFGHDSSFAGAKTAQNNSDDNGHGDFYYSPPSGFLAICTKNVAETG